MNKAVVLCRVSSKEQETEGYSLQSQEKLLGDYAVQKNFEVEKVFVISESASGHKQRQIFNSMMDFVIKNNIKEIVCEKVDRLTRNFKDAVDVNEWIDKDKTRQVHFVKEGVVLNSESKSNEKFIWNIKVSVAQYYIDNLSEEVKKGQKEKLAQGWLPAKPPLGYKTIGENGHRIHVTDDDKKHYAIKMFELYESGNWSLSKIVDHLYELGLRSDKGNKVPKSRVHSWVTDPFYIGLNRWNGETTPGEQETFISQETFDRVQELLHGKCAPKLSKHFFLFKGKIRCEECGGVITWETKKGFTYGHCNHYRNCSQAKYSKEHEVDGQVISGFENLLLENDPLTDWLRRALKESHRDEVDSHHKYISELNNRHEQLQHRLDRLYDDKLDNEIDQETYERKRKQYLEEKDEVFKSIKKQSTADEKYKKLGMNLFEVSQRAVKIYKESKNQEQKRELIGLIFQNLRLDEGKLTYEYTDEFKTLSEIATIFKSSKMSELMENPEKIFELVKSGSDKRKTQVTAHLRSSWLPEQDSNLQHLRYTNPLFS